MNNKEVWKDIPDFENYQASNMGRVRSVDRIIKYVNGNNTFTKGRVISISANRNGYMRTVLSRDKRPVNVLVHRLVCSAFFGLIQKGMEVNHKNGNKADNRLENLEVVTRSQNIIHSFRKLGRRRHSNSGEDHALASLRNEQVIEMRKLFLQGERQVNIARRFGVAPHVVYGLTSGRTYTKVWGAKECRDSASRKRGSNHPFAKLDQDKVRSIRQRHKSGESATKLSKEFGVTPENIEAVVAKRIWQHVE